MTLYFFPIVNSLTIIMIYYRIWAYLFLNQSLWLIMPEIELSSFSQLRDTFSAKDI